MAVAAKPVKDNRAIKYGRVWPNKPWGPKGKIIPCPEWYMELCILRGYDRMKAIPGNKLVSWPQHFVNFTKIVFGDPRGFSILNGIQTQCGFLATSTNTTYSQ